MSTAPPNLSVEILDAAVELMGRSGRIGRLRVRGTSMVPTIVAGQVVAVDFSPERLARGDIVLFRYNDVLVVHRLVGRASRDGRRYYRIRGDGRIRLDPPVDPEQIVGRVIALEHDGGWRGVRSLPARLYGRVLGWHDWVWAAAGVVARVAERAVSIAGIERIVCGVDRWLLRRVHRLLFERLHPRVDPPAAPAEQP